MPQLPPDTINTGPAFRKWGSSNWWQNTRLAYWNMAAAGDFSQLRTIFDYYLQMIPFLETRTAAAFNHSGLYVTETKTLFGAYDPCDYGTAAENRSESDLNFGYEESRFLKFDFGGDAGLPELCVMLLDYYAYTLDDDAMAKRDEELAEHDMDLREPSQKDIARSAEKCKDFLKTYVDHLVAMCEEFNPNLAKLETASAAHILPTCKGRSQSYEHCVVQVNDYLQTLSEYSELSESYRFKQQQLKALYDSQKGKKE